MLYHPLVSFVVGLIIDLLQLKFNGGGGGGNCSQNSPQAQANDSSTPFDTNLMIVLVGVLWILLYSWATHLAASKTTSHSSTTATAATSPSSSLSIRRRQLATIPPIPHIEAIATSYPSPATTTLSSVAISTSTSSPSPSPAPAITFLSSTPASTSTASLGPSRDVGMMVSPGGAIPTSPPSTDDAVATPTASPSVPISREVAVLVSAIPTSSPSTLAAVAAPCFAAWPWILLTTLYGHVHLDITDIMLKRSFKMLE